MEFAIVAHFEFVRGTFFRPREASLSGERKGPRAFTDEEVELIYRTMDLNDFADRL